MFSGLDGLKYDFPIDKVSEFIANYWYFIFPWIAVICAVLLLDLILGVLNRNIMFWVSSIFNIRINHHITTSSAASPAPAPSSASVIPSSGTPGLGTPSSSTPGLGLPSFPSLGFPSLSLPSWSAPSSPNYDPTPGLGFPSLSLPSWGALSSTPAPTPTPAPPPAYADWGYSDWAKKISAVADPWMVQVPLGVPQAEKAFENAIKAERLVPLAEEAAVLL